MTDDAQLQALARLARQELARQRLGDFGELMIHEYERAVHADFLCETLEAVERRDLDRVIITQPPRTGKSTNVSRALPAWWLGRRPREHVVIASHGAELAQEHSRAARAIVASPDYPFDTTISAHSSAVGRWHTTAGGGVVAVGIGGGLTGWPADLAVVDDVIADREQADSAAYRERVWRWWREVLLTRTQSAACIVVLLTRWHADDICGRILNSPGADSWQVVNLPMLAEQDDPLGREEGDPLWPEKFDREWCERRRLEVGERAWNALYQGQPTSAEGNLFRRDWLTGRYTQLPEEGLRIVTAVDASFGKRDGDYTAIVTVAADSATFYVLHAVRGRWSFNEMVAQIKSVADTYDPQAVVIEDAASGQSAIQELRRASNLPIVPVKASGSKLARAEAVSGLVEGGRVLFPAQGFRWREELIEELASFPTGRNDDLVDGLVYALRHLRERSGSGGGVAGVLYYNADGELVLDDDRPAPSPDQMTMHEVYRRTGWFDPRYGSADEFEDDYDDDESRALAI